MSKRLRSEDVSSASSYLEVQDITNDFFSTLLEKAIDEEIHHGFIRQQWIKEAKLAAFVISYEATLKAEKETKILNESIELSEKNKALVENQIASEHARPVNFVELLDSMRKSVTDALDNMKADLKGDFADKNRFTRKLIDGAFNNEAIKATLDDIMVGRKSAVSVVEENSQYLPPDVKQALHVQAVKIDQTSKTTSASYLDAGKLALAVSFSVNFWKQAHNQMCAKLKLDPNETNLDAHYAQTQTQALEARKNAETLSGKADDAKQKAEELTKKAEKLLTETKEFRKIPEEERTEEQKRRLQEAKDAQQAAREARKESKQSQKEARRAEVEAKRLESILERMDKMNEAAHSVYESASSKMLSSSAGMEATLGQMKREISSVYEGDKSDKKKENDNEMGFTPMELN